MPSSFSHDASQSRPRVRRCVLLNALVTAISLCGISGPTTTWAQALSAGTLQSFDVPAGPLASSLRTLGSKANVLLTYDSLQTQGLATAALRGQYTTDQALSLLLAGTPLEARHQSDGSYRVQLREALPVARVPLAAPLPSAPRDAVTLSEIKVLAQRGEGYDTENTTTATRTGANLRDIAQSIQVVPRAVIEDQQLNDLTSVVMNVSGIQAGTTAGNRSESFTIRGFRSSYYAVDSVMLSPAIETNDSFRDLANIERVEVLKGPASVLYGRGDPGGLINLVTKKPQFTPEANYTMQAGSDDFYRGEIDVTGPLSEENGVAYRIIGATQTGHGFRNQPEPFERTFLSTALSWEPTDSTRAMANATWQRQSSQVDRGIVSVPNADGSRYTIDLPRDRFLGEKWATFESTRKEFNYRIEHDVNDAITIRHMGHYDEGNLDLLGVNYNAVRINALTGRRTVTRTAVEQHEENNNVDVQFDMVARFNTGAIKHTAVLGVQYTDSYRFRTFFNSPLAAIDIDNPIYGAVPSGFVARPDREVNAETRAFYVQDQIDIGETVNLLIGARFDHAEQTDAGLTSYGSDEKAWSPRIGAVWKPVPNVSLFADYTKSFQAKPEPTLTGEPIPAETGEQFEAGVKADLWNQKLTLTSSVFQLTRAHVAQQDATNPGYNLDAGEQRVRGAELDITGQLTDAWKIIGSLALTDSELITSSEFPVGNALTNVPKRSGSLWATWEPNQGIGRGFGAGAGIYAASDRWGDLDNKLNIGGYTRFDASVWYRFNPKSRLTVSIKNITDENYIEAATSLVQVAPAAGRTFTVSYTGSFR